MDLVKITAESKSRDEIRHFNEHSEESFFPLAVDDYFMAVAVLSQRLSAEVSCLFYGVTDQAVCYVYTSLFRGNVMLELV